MTLRNPLLGEWACLGILFSEPSHGWAIVKHLRPDGDIGRVWHLSRPLTYRSIDQLTERGWITPVGEEAGHAGPNRTILDANGEGRSQFVQWLGEPVEHIRDIRSELLLKLVFARRLGIDTTSMLELQQEIVDRHVDVLTEAGDTDTAVGSDVVLLWRQDVAHAASRFVARLLDDSA